MRTLLGILSIVMGTQALAATPTAPQFMNRFVQSVNDRLEKINTERALKGGRLYCAQLSDEQISDIESLFVTNPSGKANQIVYRDLEKITVGQFITAVSDQLSCYPTFWPTKGRSSIGGVLFNSKSFVMDHLLLKDAMSDLAGRSPDDNESLAKIFRP
ncbi:hypothetical protein [Bdellovibrio sp. HCB337]|uniref:hypothetical protein n=1 Tax=Bdellovibrio sp. HCB337 TaxID=3394358 RepID=UPI0039A41EC6